MTSCKLAALSIAATVGMAIWFASPSSADVKADFASALTSARSSESACPPLEFDPVLSQLAQAIADQTAAWVKYDPAVPLPITNEVDSLSTGTGGVLAAMRKLGYATTLARILSGYADDRTGDYGSNQGLSYEAKAIKYAVLEGRGFDTLSDCRYTKFGVAAVSDDGSLGRPSTAPRAFSLVSAVVAGERQFPQP